MYQIIIAPFIKTKPKTPSHFDEKPTPYIQGPTKKYIFCMLDIIPCLYEYMVNNHLLVYFCSLRCGEMAHLPQWHYLKSNSVSKACIKSNTSKIGNFNKSALFWPEVFFEYGLRAKLGKLRSIYTVWQGELTLFLNDYFCVTNMLKQHIMLF